MGGELTDLILSKLMVILHIVNPIILFIILILKRKNYIMVYHVIIQIFDSKMVDLIFLKNVKFIGQDSKILLIFFFIYIYSFKFIKRLLFMLNLC
jgi:hypothetical protein